MLLTRCNVTVKSFKWSDKAKVINTYTFIITVEPSDKGPFK